MLRLAGRRTADKAWSPSRLLEFLPVVVGIVLFAFPPAPARAQVAPDSEWRTLRTEHFAVTFPRGQEALARRAAARGEAAWEALRQVLPEPEARVVELLLTDDVDLSNGTASVSPAPRVRVWLRPPVDGLALSRFDRWIDLVVSHELAHVFHLDASGGPGSILRTVFGRVPAGWPFFANASTPRWVIEGIATWYETAYTGTGRADSPFFRMMLRTAALEGAFETIDRSSGESPQWPAGQRPYLYGGLFVHWLLDEYGVEPLRRFVDEVGGQWIPFRMNAAARTAFGISLSDAWEAWAGSWSAQAADTRERWTARGPLTVPEALTFDGREVLYPRVAPDGSVLVARADGRSDPQIRRLDPGAPGASGDFVVRTHGLVRFDVARTGAILWAQPEFEDPYRIRSDLWLREPDGDVRRLTRGGRLDHPSFGPDGTWAVAVRYAGDRTELVRIALASGEVTSLAAPEDGPRAAEGAAGAWAFPAVSPDGRWVAVNRWDGNGSRLLVLDAVTGRVRLEVAGPGAVEQAPAWGPRGEWLLWGSDRSGIPQVEAVRVVSGEGAAGTRRAVTRVLSGAAFPAVDREGEHVYFSRYTSRGWELARTPFTPERWPDADPAADRGAPPIAPVAPTPARVEDYRSLPSLRPRYWEPVLVPALDRPGGDLIRPALGFGTTATDLAGRHAVGLQAALSLDGEHLYGSGRWEYRGLGNPVLDLQVDQAWDGTGGFLAQAPDAPTPELLYIRERERRVSLGVSLLQRRWTWDGRLTGRVGMIWEDRELLDARFDPATSFRLLRPEARFLEGQLSLLLSNARGHALSVSTEEGAALFLRARTRRQQALPDSLDGRVGLDRSRVDLLGRLAAWQSFPGPGFGDHVVALRLAGGVARGPGADALTWEVGGASGGADPFTGLDLFGGTGSFFPVRGHPEARRTGRYAWSGSAEYRFPLALVNRGLGLFPLHLDRVHGSLFADAGNAWGPELGQPRFQQPRGDVIWSGGAQLSADLLTFFNVPLQLRVGAAVLRGVGSARLDGPVWFVRLGPSF